MGSGGPFSQNAALPADIAGGQISRKKTGKATGQKPTQARRSPDAETDRKAAAAYAKEEDRRRREREKEESARQKARERQQQAIEEAQAVLETARRKHEQKAAAIRTEIETLEARLRAEDARWDKEKSRLDDLLRRARR